MKNIKLLDCTLRDGGSINNFIFGSEALIEIYQSLNDAKIDMIELGFIDNNTINDVNSTKKPSNSHFDELKIHNKHCKTYAMIDFSKYDDNNFNITKRKNLDGIRLMFKKEQLNDAIYFAKKIKELDYEISLNPVSITRYTKEEFIDLINKANKLEPQFFYMVDTYGLMNEIETLEYFNLLEKHLNKNIQIGYHVHDNLQLAFKNAIEIINQKTTREIIIDCSLFGMGKRAGNIKTEDIANFLNKNFKKNYDISILEKIIQNKIIPLKSTYEWGFSQIHYIAGKNKCHSDYVTYLNKEKNISLDEIDQLLKVFDEDKRLSFDAEYANLIARNFTKW